jgi:hypothetical protein
MQELAYLKTADESIRDIILEECTSLVVLATPTPDIFAVTVGFALVENTSANTPHDDAKDKECNSKGGVVDGHLLRSPVTSAPVGIEDEDTHGKRNTGNDKESDLRPYWGIICPRRKTVSWGKVSGSVEDGENSSQHS